MCFLPFFLPVPLSHTRGLLDHNVSKIADHASSQALIVLSAVAILVTAFLAWRGNRRKAAVGRVELRTLLIVSFFPFPNLRNPKRKESADLDPVLHGPLRLSSSHHVVTFRPRYLPIFVERFPLSKEADPSRHPCTLRPHRAAPRDNRRGVLGPTGERYRRNAVYRVSPSFDSIRPGLFTAAQRGGADPGR